MEQPNTKSAFLALAFLGLLTLADSVTDSSLPTLADISDTQPGFWNSGTLAIVLKGASDLIAPIFLGYILSTKSKHYAMNVNTTSILAAAAFTLLSLLSRRNWPALAATGGPLIRCFGGGSHALTFLILTILHNQDTAHLRSAYYYATGAVAILAQALGPLLTSALVDRNHFLPGALSCLCCVLSYGIVNYLKHAAYAPRGLSQDEMSSVSAPLLPNRQQTRRKYDFPLAEYLSRYFGRRSLLTGCNLRFVPRAFFLMAICKATRPLFTTYIQYRADVSPAEAQALWHLRSAMSVAILGILLPCIFLGNAPNISSSNIDLHLGRISILLISAGAFMIGLSGSLSTITTALIINTLGVAIDFNLFAFASNLFDSPDAGSVLLPIASIESLGTLLGIGLLYPVYQWSINEYPPSFAGGMPYYICGLLYAVVAGLLWSLNPSRQVSEP